MGISFGNENSNLKNPAQKRKISKVAPELEVNRGYAKLTD